MGDIGGSVKRSRQRQSVVSRHGGNLPPWKKLLFAAVAFGGFFVALEVVLAAFGVRPVLYSDDPYVGFAANIPLFVEQATPDGKVQMVTAPNKIGWFNKQSFPKKKASGAYRIFSVGGSTTHGRPYDDTVSFSGWLREFLPVADPSRNWEVINAGGVSYASYRVAALMEELAGYEPDLFLIYSGHNEFLERRTYRGLIEAPSFLPAAGGVLSRTRVYAAGLEAVRAASRLVERDSEESTELAPEVDEILARTVGPIDYTRDDEFRRQVIAHYRFNLNRMVDIAESAGAAVIFVIPASNLKDVSPFKSEHPDSFSTADLAQFDLLFKGAVEARAAAKPADALAALDDAARLDGRYADLHYQRGLALFDLRRFDEARGAFERALDEDICPLRILPEMKRIIAEVASARNVPLIDFASYIEGQSEHGITGADWFLDHVHLTKEGYREIALRLLDKMAGAQIVTFSPGWNEQALAAATQRVESRIDRVAQGKAFRNLARVFGWAGKSEEAARIAAKSIELLGDDPESYNVLGRRATQEGKTADAIRYFRQALAVNPDYADAHANLGNELLAQGELEDAMRHLRRAIELKPSLAEPHANLGLALAWQGKPDEALAEYRKAIGIDPRSPEAHNNLGAELTALGRPSEAEEHFRAALRTRPKYVDAHINLGLALNALNRGAEAIEHLREAIRLKPDSAEAHYNLGVALQLDEKLDEAVGHYNQALAIRPEYAQAHYNLAVALIAQDKSEEAIAHLSKALALEPSLVNDHPGIAELLKSGQ